MEAVRLNCSDQTYYDLILIRNKSDLQVKEVKSHRSGTGLSMLKSPSATYQLWELGQIVKPFVPHFFSYEDNNCLIRLL